MAGTIMAALAGMAVAWQPAAAEAERWEPIAGTNRPTEVDRSRVARVGGSKAGGPTAWIRTRQPDGTVQTVLTEFNCAERTFRGIFLIQSAPGSAEIRMDGSENPAQQIEAGTDPEDWHRDLCAADAGAR